ncbi:phage tail protein [Sphingosinithalassobacter sp. LHW66-3]|uniref:phage tail protein n=1 Tax=Sphingosinithalassobacter sp. LHW66-3 TaxID=3424718 RepID=UPI003D6C4F41
MAQPYLGEIRMFAGNFAPAGWMLCEGQLIPISENETLFQLIGTTYGGDGQSTFQLPDLRGRVPIHMGDGFILAETGGAEEVTLTASQIPMHTHNLVGSSGNGSQSSPLNNYLASSTLVRPYASETPDTLLAATSIGATGGSQPHTNMQPYLCINFIISLFGLFPSPT